MVKYALTYFDAGGRAEISRLIFAAAGKQFEDRRIEFKAWPELKDKTPFKSLPFLEVDGKQIGQSGAIARFLAREFGLNGKTSLDAAKADSIRDAVSDLMVFIFTDVFYAKDDASKAASIKAIEETKAPTLFAILEKMLEENKGGKGYFVGESLTYADLSLVDLMTNLTNATSVTLDKFPKLKALHARVVALPKVAAYLASKSK